MVRRLNTERPRYSVIVPARDEERYIAKCLDSIRLASAPYPGQVEVIVALNRCTDRTGEIARSFGATTIEVEGKNLSLIRNAAAREATGDVLVTIDADSTMSANMLSEIERRLSSGAFIGGGVTIWPDRMSPGILISGVLIALVLLVRRGISGGLFWAYRRDFQAIGGFDESLVATEDLDFAMRLRAHGRRLGKRFGTIWGAHITTSCRKFDRLGDWFMLKNFKLVREILSGRDEPSANFYFYDFPRT
jgi:glycosyltransferase involved in cell wall biosynthesis